MSATSIALLLGAGLLAEPSPSPDPCAGLEPTLGSAAEALDSGRLAEAGRLLQPLSAAHPDCAGAVLGMARLRAAQRDTAQAERLFARATSLAPDHAPLHAHFAQYWLSRGQPAQADYLSALALSLDPQCSEALVVQARIFSLKGRPDSARQALEQALRLQPENVEAHYELGLWLYRRLQHAEAVPHFEVVAARRPADARALDYLALSLERLGEAERAERAYRRALELSAGPFADPFLDYYYGRFLLKQDRLDESRSHLDRAVARHPYERAAHYERAKLSLQLKEYAAARESAERALSLRDPGGVVIDLQVYYLLATVYARLGEAELARKYADLARTAAIPDQAADRPR